MNNKAQQILEVISKAENICFLTGAGVSTLSGIPDFQSLDKAWTHPYPREVMISRPFFNKEPDYFWSVYRELFHSKADAQPNAVHQWIAGLERNHGRVSVVTQNVDGLHDLAGSSNVYPVHGDVRKTICVNPKCRARFDDSFAFGTNAPTCTRCFQPLKPDVVLFGEMPKRIFEAETATYTSDVLVVMGTSLQVNPVARLPIANKILRPYATQVWIDKNSPPRTAGLSFDHEFVGEFSDFLANV